MFECASRGAGHDKAKTIIESSNRDPDAPVVPGRPIAMMNVRVDGRVPSVFAEGPHNIRLEVVSHQLGL